MSRESVLETLRAAAPVIGPSLLKCDFSGLSREIAKLDEAGAVMLHWDVMDGHFVPNLSYGGMVIQSCRAATSLIFDAHLMIADPAKYLDTFVKAGCQCLTVHIEAVPEPTGLLRRIREADIVAGLALNPGTPVERILPYLDEVDQILVMSVEPGFGGQKFIPSALEKLRVLRSRAASGTILSVDGGIDPSTISDAAAAGAHLFVAGSAVFDMPDYGPAIDGLRRRAAV